VIGLYKVLIADDEKLDLEGMKAFVPWNELGMEVVDGVSNGFAACKILEEEKIDILVTDVQMPNMSGLELAKRALEKWKDIKIIFVSGYQDFTYAKQALSLNACDYLLKPMDDQELIDSLIKVSKIIDEERTHQELYWQMVPLVKNEYLLQLFEGSYNAAGLNVLHNEYRLKDFAWPGRISILELDDLPWKLNASDEKEQVVVMNNLLQHVASVCKVHNIEHICKISNKRLALLMEEAMMLPVLEQLIQQIKHELSFTITIGVGGALQGVAEIQQSYIQATEALNYKMFQGKGKIIQYGEVRTTEIDDAKMLEIRIEALIHAMSNYELVRIHDELESLFQTVRNMRSKLTIQNFAMYILMKLDNHLHTINEDLFQLLGLELKSFDIVLQLETIDDIQSWLRRRAYEISEMLYNKKHNKNWNLIQEIIDYVRVRMNNNITLRDVAEQFSFSPNYLGLLFKEVTGKNFSEYLIMMRLEKACDLLKNTNLKIYEVADKVGHRYLPYFSRQFKETYGVTPLEYRRK
jgi:two-component system response regulator YesN